jgi:hypothetical protein
MVSSRSNPLIEASGDYVDVSILLTPISVALTKYKELLVFPEQSGSMGGFKRGA